MQPGNINRRARQTTDWRQALRRNQQKTIVVIGMFFLIYLGIGMLGDMARHGKRHPDLELDTILFGLLHFHIFPLVTLLMLLFAAASLWASYALYDRLMLLGTQSHEIFRVGKNQDPRDKQLYNAVDEMKIAAKLCYMPRVFIIEAAYMNAFASGYSEKSAMLAITRGLMEKLNRDELQAVMAHEITHIRHLDIKLNLTASLLANISLMTQDLFFLQVVPKSGRRADKNSADGGIFILIIFALRFFLRIFYMFTLPYLSRAREFMADAGCVELMRTNQPLANALLKIHVDHTENRYEYAALYKKTSHESVRQAAYFYNPDEIRLRSGGSLIGDLLSTHPSLGARFKALGLRLPPM